MDYAELRKKNLYTDLTVYNKNLPPEDYITQTDIIGDEQDLHDINIGILADYRPDPRTLESDQKQTRTDSVSVLRLHYAGTRAGDEPSNYNREIFLEDTEPDERGWRTDPDFRKAVQQTYGRQKFLKTNLYPDDPGTGSITQGNVSKKGEVLRNLQGRELSVGYYRSMLQDSLDGVEPRREFRFDPYSYIDKTLANQGDLPYANPDRVQHMNTPIHSVVSFPEKSKVEYTDGEVVLEVAKLGRGTTAHRSAETNNKIFNNQIGNPNAIITETGRAELMTDLNKLYSTKLPTILNDTIRKIVETTMRDESKNAKSANTGMLWGSARENVRKALDAAITQQQMLVAAEIQNNKGIRGNVKHGAGGGKDLLKTQTTEAARNLLSVYKDLINKSSIPMSSMKNATEYTKNIKQEINQINENWRRELQTGIAKARSSLNDDVQKVMHGSKIQSPWNETAGRDLVVFNYRGKKATDMQLAQRHQQYQVGKYAASNESVSIHTDSGRTTGDTNSLVYQANQGMPFSNNMFKDGVKGGSSGKMGDKQKVRFKSDENTDDRTESAMDVGDVEGRKQVSVRVPKYY
jgi:hypothetical protein